MVWERKTCESDQKDSIHVLRQSKSNEINKRYIYLIGRSKYFDGIFPPTIFDSMNRNIAAHGGIQELGLQLNVLDLNVFHRYKCALLF